jgi:UTP--glucose-1-phosphate uridylyltransferase
MKVRRAVITAAARRERALPLHTLVDCDGSRKSVLRIIVQEALGAGVEAVCVVVCPGDEAAYADAVEELAPHLAFVTQPEADGYGHAVLCAREFTEGEPFLHLMGDHVYVARGRSYAQQVVSVAETTDCSVSSVQPTREGLLPYFGVIGGARVPGTPDRYLVGAVREKPSPTLAEQELVIPGIRAGHYLCFSGMHVLTPVVMEILADLYAARKPNEKLELSPALNELARRERYEALEVQGIRYPVDVRYGMLLAQMGLALNGRDRDLLLALITENLAQAASGGAPLGPMAPLT